MHDEDRREAQDERHAAFEAMRSPLPHLLVDGREIVAANAAAVDVLGAQIADDALETDAIEALRAPCEIDLVGGGSLHVLAETEADAGRRVLAVLPSVSSARESLPGAFAHPLAGVVGEAYLERLLLHVAEVTGADEAFVAEIAGSSAAPELVTLFRVREGVEAPEVRLPLTDAFFSALHDGAEVMLSDRLSSGPAMRDAIPGSAFPESASRGFAGVPLREGEQVLGALALIFDEPVPDIAFVGRLLRGYAPRTSVELQRLRFEHRMAESEHRYRDLVESSDDGLIVFRGRKPVYANPAAARMLGYGDPAELCSGANLDTLVGDPDRDMVHRMVEARRAGIRGDSVFEIGARHRDGQIVPVQVSMSDLQWNGEAAVQVLIVDLTARKARQERTRQAERMASLGKLTGGIAHDFNNLLAVIIGNLELVAQDAPASLERPVGQARIAAQRGADLTERLLTFARRQALRPQLVEPAALLEETRALVAPVLGEDIEVTIRADVLPAVEVDPSQLQSALINLAVNARDAIDGGGRLTISARQVEAEEMRRRFPEAPDADRCMHVCVEVADSGRGMPAEVRSQAFEPFFTTKGARKGSGLGLSMVHGFVKQSRGHIELDSAPDEGTRVRLYLPCADAPPAKSAPEPVPVPARDADAPVGAGRRALVIEDEDSVREVAVAMLEGLGFSVSEAADGPSGRDALARGHFDFLLSDVVLPAGQRGPDIAAEALGRDTSMAVLFMSGYAETSDFQKFRLEHDFRLLRKPFRFDQLRSEIETVLANAGDAAR